MELSKDLLLVGIKAIPFPIFIVQVIRWLKQERNAIKFQTLILLHCGAVRDDIVDTVAVWGSE